MKDNFSLQSDQYAKYRPGYPPELFEFLNSTVAVKENAWDCGTGNGQVAFELAKTFERVFATDISESQLNNALGAENIHYSVQAAEKTSFRNQQFNLITVAQAIRWFDFEKFYAEVRRTAKEGAVICVIGYGIVSVSKQIDALISTFYTDIIGSYWDKERKYIDDSYQTIPFPFREITAPVLENKLAWNLEHLIGYVNTWSAVKHFIKQNGFNPVDELRHQIASYWNEKQPPEVRFPLLLRVGRI